MNPSKAILDICLDSDLNFFASVPCSNLDSLLKLINEEEAITHTPVTREEEGLGILSGAYLGGKRPAMIMQSSGLGNSINALSSLVQYYGIPLIMLISHRGTQQEKIDAQRPMGQSVKDLLESINLPWYEIESTNDIGVLKTGIKTCRAENQPGAFLFPIRFWDNNA